MPLRPWRGSPERYATPISISGDASLRRNAASSAILALRLEVSATRRDVRTRSAKSVIELFYRPGARLLSMSFDGVQEDGTVWACARHSTNSFLACGVRRKS